MEPVGAWSPAQAAAWLRGLDAAVQGYPFEAWGLRGAQVLRLSAGALEALGVRRVGHQELLLEAVEQLRALDEEPASTSLRALAGTLRALARRAQALALGERRAGAEPRPPSLELLACVVDLVGAAKELFSWLNRYLFSTLNDYSASRDIVHLCAELVEALQGCQHIVGICEGIVGCSPAALLDCTAVLQRVELAPALPPAAALDLEIMSTSSGQHFVSGTASEALPERGSPVLPGDEIVQVNEQVVVGWTRANLEKKLLEKPSGATLVLKKIPLSLPGSPQAARQPVSDPSAPSTAPVPDWVVLGEWKGVRRAGACCRRFCPRQKARPRLEAPDGALISPGGQKSRGAGLAGASPLLRAAALPPPLLFRGGRNARARATCEPGQRRVTWRRHLRGRRTGPDRRGFLPRGIPVPYSTAADWELGPDLALDPTTDDEEEEERDCSLPGQDVGDLGALGDGASEDAAAGRSAPPASPRSPGALAAASPVELGPPGAAGSGAGSRGAQPSQLPGEGSPKTCCRTKGVATRLSRRRVSCRDLGRVDCDGWLLKKKDHVGFMAQKWKRCWFVLKGHTLYWYNHPNDEKAAGLINMATYDLESTREQKKKYVFQLSHEKYKPFIFAAETLADLSMWVSHLITAKTKYTLAHQSVPQKEEDCYSETEAEDPDDDSPRHGCDSPKRKLQNAPEKAQLFLASGEPSSAASSPQGSPRPCSPMDSSGEDLESLMQGLKQGGVSLIGRQRFLTEEQYRKSFIKRNKNPLINEKVHLVRALQSTLKAKLTELQVLEQLLSDAALTSEKFTSWKEEHQDLYQELREWWVRQQGQDLDGGLGAEPSPLQEAAEP
ncbi:connector enhancer of kinase suppressor of ras 1 [Rhea pennata]|uniref:connector enhancer of kinase suppressor of ras 1 n=1 Tax=Rhea pennata TaxID=8795 RepID=UPI002E255029